MPIVDFQDCCTYTPPTTMPSLGCPVEWGQIVRIALQIKQSTPSFATAADLVDNAEWTTLLAPATPPANNQILITPPTPDGKTGLFGFAVTGGEAVTQGGGDNTTLNGIPIIVSRNFASVTANLYSIGADLTKTLMELLDCGKNLTAYFINSYGQVIAKQNGTSYEGFNIYSGFLKDRDVTGEFERDVNVLTFQLEKGYSKNFYISPAAAFLGDIVNP